MTNNIENPLVTVAMVTYNSSQYVRMAIESVLASSYTNFELIISDDCSTDNTWEIINEYKDSRIRAYRNDKNIGEYPNRNKCIDLAKGEYLIFIDGDDMLINGAFEYAVTKMKEFPDCAMACGYMERENLIYPLKLTPVQSFRFNYFGQSFLTNSFSQTLFITQILKKIGGVPEIYISGDYVVKAKIAALYNVLIIYPLLGWWRLTPNQASSALKKMDISLIEKYKMEQELLNLSSFPLSNVEKIIIFEKLRNQIFRHILKNILCLKLSNLPIFIKLYSSIKRKKNKTIKLPPYYLITDSSNPIVNFSSSDSFDKLINK